MLEAPIILIDDDSDDCEFMNVALKGLSVPNALIIFNNTYKALQFLKETTDDPFFIICDVNMPLMTGLELRQALDKDEAMRQKAIPFLVWSTGAEENLVNEAYSLNIQGFFQKPSSIPQYQEMLKAIMAYWTCSQHPGESKHKRLL